MCTPMLFAKLLYLCACTACAQLQFRLVTQRIDQRGLSRSVSLFNSLCLNMLFACRVSAEHSWCEGAPSHKVAVLDGAKLVSNALLQSSSLCKSSSSL